MTKGSSSPALEEQVGGALRLGVLDSYVGYHLRRASAVFAADFNRVIGDLGIRQVPFAVLTMIARYPGVNQGAIGQALGIQRANMVALVTDLITRGLVERSRANGDRRAFALSVTPAGASLMSECLLRLDRHEAELLADFKLSERDVFVELLQRIEAKEREPVAL